MNRFLDGVRVDPTGAISIQLVDDVLDRVGQPTLMVGGREGEAPPVEIPPAGTKSLVADDGMRRIRFFQVCNLVLGQGYGEGVDGSFQMRDLRCPDDGCRHRLLL
jgi:hypothetical protein